MPFKKACFFVSSSSFFQRRFVNDFRFDPVNSPHGCPRDKEVGMWHTNNTHTHTHTRTKHNIHTITHNHTCTRTHTHAIVTTIFTLSQKKENVIFVEVLYNGWPYVFMVASKTIKSGEEVCFFEEFQVLFCFILFYFCSIHLITFFFFPPSPVLPFS